MAKWTVQSLIDGKMTVTAYCHAVQCGHHQVLNLEKLRDRLGPDAPAMAVDLEPKLVCSKCRGKKLGLIYAPDDAKVFGMGKATGNQYAKAKGS
jgi:hypothetical protein